MAKWLDVTTICVLSNGFISTVYSYQRNPPEVGIVPNVEVTSPLRWKLRPNFWKSWKSITRNEKKNWWNKMDRREELASSSCQTMAVNIVLSFQKVVVLYTVPYVAYSSCHCYTISAFRLINKSNSAELLYYSLVIA